MSNEDIFVVVDSCMLLDLVLFVVDMVLWIIKEGGNCCMLFDWQCLEWMLQIVYVEFLQLDLVGYWDGVLVLFVCWQQLSVDEMVDLLICEVELCVDFIVLEWEYFVVCLYLC